MTGAAVVTALVKHGNRRAGLSGTAGSRPSLTGSDYLTLTELLNYWSKVHLLTTLTTQKTSRGQTLCYPNQYLVLIVEAFLQLKKY